jgi:hypothetical protein
MRDSFQRDFAVQKLVVRIERQLYGASAAVLVERRPAFRMRLHGDLIDTRPCSAVARARPRPPGPGLRELDAEFSTAGLATLRDPRSEPAALDPATAELVGFIWPRDVEG